MLHAPSPSPLFVPSPPAYREVENETLTPVVMYKLVHGCVKLYMLPQTSFGPLF